MANDELIERARAVVNPRTIAHGGAIGNVGCALVTDRGNCYVGVSIDVCSGMGFCAEHSAIASMVTHGEQRITKIVAVLGDGKILPPCGRCRELMRQIDPNNLDNTEVLLGRNRAVKLRELLPHAWDE